ncbi:MAG: acetyltransferase [Clostridium sp.]|nr:acetyltransferase [Clostridium sp.]
MKDLIIIGAGGLGREVAWLIDEINEINMKWNLLGYIDDDKDKIGKYLNGYPVLGGFEYLENKKDIYYVCAIANSKIKKEIIEKRCRKYNIKPATLIHPSVIMSRKYNEIGEGCIICINSSITVNTKLKNHITINPGCTIGHDITIDNYTTIYPGVNISGNCDIGECVEIGTGSQIIQGKSIGSNSIVGAGSVVIKDIEKNSTAVGVPAKVIK